MSLDFRDDQSTLVQLMAWCRQAASHYLSQCWPRPLSPYDVTRPQWVNSLSSLCVILHAILSNISNITLTWVNIGPVLFGHMASLGYNVLKRMIEYTVIFFHILLSHCICRTYLLYARLVWLHSMCELILNIYICVCVKLTSFFTCLEKLVLAFCTM